MFALNLKSTIFLLYYPIKKKISMFQTSIYCNKKSMYRAIILPACCLETKICMYAKVRGENMYVENEWQMNLHQWQLMCSNSPKQVQSEVTTGKGLLPGNMH